MPVDNLRLLIELPQVQKGLKCFISKRNKYIIVNNFNLKIEPSLAHLIKHAFTMQKKKTIL